MNRLLPALLLLLAGCASPIQVAADYEPATDFTPYTSFAWLPVSEETRAKHPGLDSELTEKRLHTAVERELTAKGYRFVDNEPSAWLVYHAAIKRRIDASTVNSGYAYGRAHGGTHTWVREYDEGTLLLDILDGKDKGLVWRGAARGEVDLFGTIEERTERLNAAVKKLLAQYPPGSTQ